MTGIGEEQARGAEAAKRRIEELAEGRSYSTVVWIDDYHPECSRLDVQEYMKTLRGLEAPPTWIAFESGSVAAAEKLIRDIEGNGFVSRKKNGDAYLRIQGNGGSLVAKAGRKHFCHLLSAAWALQKLGALGSEPLFTGMTEEKPFSCRNIITILPESYKENEDKAIRLIEKSSYHRYLENMEYLWI